MLDKMKEDYNLLVNKRIKEVIADCSFKSSDYSISYEQVESVDRKNNTNSSTRMRDIYAKVSVKDELTGETTVSGVKLLDMPVLTHTGFKLNNTLYQVVASYKRATGFLLSDNKNIPSGVEAIVITDQDVPNLRIIEKSKKLELDGKPLPVMLKILSGLSYTELADKIGSDLPIVAESFAVNKSKLGDTKSIEPTLSECISMVEKDKSSNKQPIEIVKRWRNAYFNEGVEVLDARDKTLSRDYRVRLEKALSFKKIARATGFGATLTHDVLDFKAGDLFTNEVATALDHSEETSVTVNYKSSNYTIKYYRNKNLTRVQEKSITLEDLFNITNRYALCVAGIDLIDKKDEVSNKSLYTFSDKVLDTIEQKLSKITSSLCKVVKSRRLEAESEDIENDTAPSPLITYVVEALENISSKDSNDLSKFIKVESKDSQTSDLNNTIAYTSRSFKAYDESTTNASIERRGIFDSFLGIICPFTAPESGKVGLNHTLTLEAVVDDEGFKTKLIDVRGSEIIDVVRNGKTYRQIRRAKVVILSPEEYQSMNVATWDVDLTEDTVSAIKDGKGIKIPVEDLDYMLFSPFSIVSIQLANINFLNHIDGKRDVMAANQNSQKIFILGSEPSLISTGVSGTYDVGFTRGREILRQYYVSSNLADVIDEDEFCNSELTFVRATKELQDMYIEFQVDFDDRSGKPQSLSITHSVPYMIKNEKNSLYTTRICKSSYNEEYDFYDSKIYGPDTIVYHNIDMFVDTYKQYHMVGQGEVDRWFEDNYSEIEAIKNEGSEKEFPSIRTRINDHIDYGYKIPNKDFMKVDMLLGRNLYVGYKTFEGTTIDDSITASDKLVGLNLMTSLTVKLLEYHRPTNEDKSPVRCIIKPIGTHLGNNDVVCAMFKKDKSGVEKQIDFKTKDTECGQILDVNMVDDKIHVLIADTARLKTGDKGAGEHGNKGVFAKIVPWWKMPYSKETGVPLDICLNPLGVPTRMNPGQMVLIKLGQALVNMSKEKGKPCRIVISQFNRVTKDIAEALKGGFLGIDGVAQSYVSDRISEGSELSDLIKYAQKPEIMVDGRTGKEFPRPIETGYIYFSKLEHTVDSKVSGTEVPNDFDSRSGRPGRGKEGGQKLGEMENIRLRIEPVPHLQNYFFNMKMDTSASRKKALEVLSSDSNSLDYGSRNTEATKVFLQSYYTAYQANNETKEGEVPQVGYSTRPLTDKMIMSMGDAPLNQFSQDIKPILSDPKLFGTKDGKDINNAFVTQWSYIDLRAEIPSPIQIYKSSLAQTMLVNSCDNIKPTSNPGSFEPNWKLGQAKQDMFKTLMAHNINKSRKVSAPKAYVYITEKDIYYITDNQLSLVKSKGLNIEIPIEELQTGIIAVVNILKTMKVKTMLDAWSGLYSGEDTPVMDTGFFSKGKNTTKYVKASKAIATLRSLLAEKIEFKDYVVSKFPVAPHTFRYSESGKVEEDNDFEKFYVQIANSIKVSEDKAIGNEDASKEAFLAVVKFLGCDDNNRDTEREDMKSWFLKDDNKTGKKGYMRTCIKGTRVPYSGRSVIIPDANMQLTPYEIGIPFFQILKVAKTFFKTRLQEELDSEVAGNEGLGLVNYLSDKPISDILEAVQASNMDKLATIINKRDEGLTPVETARIVWEKIFKLVSQISHDELIVMCGRQPTLQANSWLAYIPKIVRGHAIELHPSTCKGYNADFDGDQMHFEVIPGREAKLEAMKYMMVDSTMVKYEGGGNWLAPTQDILVGLYMSTMLYNNAITIYGEEVIGEEKVNDNGIMRKCTKLKLNGDKRYTTVKNYTSLARLKEDIEDSVISRWELVCYTHINGYRYLSTAGRIYFNSILKDGFTDKPFSNVLKLPTVSNNWTTDYGYPVINPNNYRELKHDAVISGSNNSVSYIYDESQDTTPITGEVVDKIGCLEYSACGKVLLKTKDSFGITDTIRLIDEMKIMGFAGADKIGISIALEDFMLSEEKDKIVAKADRIVASIRKSYSAGLVSHKDKDKMEEKIYAAMKAKLLKGIMDPFSRDNNLFILIDSGARGSKANIMQTCGLIGHVSAGKRGNMPTPVMSNYVEGLTAFEYLIAAAGTRLGFVVQQLGVANAGYMSNKTAQILEGILVTQDDCGVKSYRSLLELSYGRLTFMRSSKGLLGKRISESDVSAYKYVNSTNGIITKDNIRNILATCGKLMLVDNDGKDYEYSMEDVNLYKLVENKDYVLSKSTPYYDNCFVATEGTVDTGDLLSKEVIDIITRRKADKVVFNNTITYTNGNGKEESCNETVYLFYNLDKAQTSQLIDRFTGHLRDPKVKDSYRYIYDPKLAYELQGETDDNLRLKANGDMEEFMYLKAMRDLREGDCIVRDKSGNLFKGTDGDVVYAYLPGLTDRYTITESTINYIEKYNIRTLPFRNLITCRAAKGICAKCYGLKKNTYKSVDSDIQLDEVDMLSKDTINAKKYNTVRSSKMIEYIDYTKDIDYTAPWGETELARLNTFVKPVINTKSDTVNTLGGFYDMTTVLEWFPVIGTRLGCIASTTLGAGITQSNLDKVNSGAGGGEASAANDITSLVEARSPKEAEINDLGFDDAPIKEGVIASYDSVIRLEKVGKKTTVSLLPLQEQFKDKNGEPLYDKKKESDVIKKIHKVTVADTVNVIVSNNEVVRAGDYVVAGYTGFDNVALSTDPDKFADNLKKLRKKQMTVYKCYCDALISETSDTNAVFLEMFARVQGEMVGVYSSNSNNIKQGEYVSLTKLEDELEKNPDFRATLYGVTASPRTIHRYWNDTMKGIAFELVMENLSELSMNVSKKHSTSFLSTTLTGAPNTDMKFKAELPKPPKYVKNKGSVLKENLDDIKIIDISEAIQEDLPEDLVIPDVLPDTPFGGLDMSAFTEVMDNPFDMVNSNTFAEETSNPFDTANSNPFAEEIEEASNPFTEEFEEASNPFAEEASNPFAEEFEEASNPFAEEVEEASSPFENNTNTSLGAFGNVVEESKKSAKLYISANIDGIPTDKIDSISISGTVGDSVNVEKPTIPEGYVVESCTVNGEEVDYSTYNTPKELCNEKVVINLKADSDTSTGYEGTMGNIFGEEVTEYSVGDDIMGGQDLFSDGGFDEI